MSCRLVPVGQKRESGRCDRFGRMLIASVAAAGKITIALNEQFTATPPMDTPRRTMRTVDGGRNPSTHHGRVFYFVNAEVGQGRYM